LAPDLEPSLRGLEHQFVLRIEVWVDQRGKRASYPRDVANLDLLRRRPIK
jgi:hypothetical protein